MSTRMIVGLGLALALSLPGGAQAAPSKVKSVCLTDFQKLCSGGDAAKRGAVMRCVKTRLDQVGPECKAAVQAAQEKNAAKRAAKLASAEPKAKAKAQ